jgi:hypothetical protein
MKKSQRKRHAGSAQQVLFQAPRATPSVPEEVLREVQAALADLLLEAARPGKKEAADEREDF